MKTCVHFQPSPPRIAPEASRSGVQLWRHHDYRSRPRVAACYLGLWNLGFGVFLVLGIWDLGFCQPALGAVPPVQPTPSPKKSALSTPYPTQPSPLSFGPTPSPWQWATSPPPPVPPTALSGSAPRRACSGWILPRLNAIAAIIWQAAATCRMTTSNNSWRTTKEGSGRARTPVSPTSS